MKKIRTILSFLFMMLAASLHCSQKKKFNDFLTMNAFIEKYGSKGLHKLTRGPELITASINDNEMTVCCVDDPDQKITLPYSLDNSSLSRYVTALGVAEISYNYKTGDTIILYPRRDFLHVGKIDQDTILKRVYVDGRQLHYNEMDERYFDLIRNGIDELRPQKDGCCTIS